MASPPKPALDSASILITGGTGSFADGARGVREPLPAEEGAVVRAGEEARLLTLGTTGRGEPGALGLRARLVFRLSAERKPEPVEEAREAAAAAAPEPRRQRRRARSSCRTPTS